MQLEPFEGLKLVEEAAIKRREDQLFQMWLEQKPEMNFDDFKYKNGIKNSSANQIDEDISQEQILEDVKGIINMTL